MRNSKAFLFILGFAALTLAACGPQKEDHKAPSKPMFSGLSEKAGDCETKLVQQMKAKSILLKPVSGLEKESQRLNDSIQSAQKTTYQVAKLNDQVSELAIEHEQITDSIANKIKYQINPPGKLTSYLIQMSIEISTITRSSAIQISQEIGVNEKCELIVGRTEFSDLKKEDKNKVSVRLRTVYPDGDDQVESKEFEVPEGKVLSDFFNDTTTATSLPDVEYLELLSYSPVIGLANITLKATNNVKNVKDFGMDLNLQMYQIKYTAKDLTPITLEYGIDEKNAVTVSYQGKSRTWKGPEAIFNTFRLGGALSSDAYVKSELSETYLDRSNTIEIVGEKKPTYKFFDAYWNLLSERKESDGMTVFTYQENTERTFKSTPSAIDLKSNNTIQTELPEIQKIAKEIKNKAPNNRKGQIELILRYLNEHYSFDNDMAKNNVIRPLTTQEALSRGKGVCQHYAVIFVSIARALKIPSATVSGYSLMGGSAGGHAWVEAEIRPGVWKVIEPQAAQGLETTNARFYIPTGRQGLLEDRDLLNKNVQETMDNVFTIRPVSN